jgi:virulence-associated protein VapD
MYAISFDLNVNTLTVVHAKGYRQAYRDIERELAAFGFRRVQQSVYLAEGARIGEVFSALEALKALMWFADAVTDIRVFRVEDWSDVTQQIKARP